MSTSLLTLILQKSMQHIQLWFCSTVLSCLIGLVLAFIIYKKKATNFAPTLLSFATLVQTIPGLAFIAIIEVILLALSSSIYIPVIGFLPSIIILTTYGIFPVLKDSYLGLRKVFPLTNAGTRTISKRKKTSMIPIMILGCKSCSIQLFGLATLTSLIGSGGLGDLILQGLQQFQIQLALSGAIPIIIMIFIIDMLFASIGKWLNPYNKSRS